MENNGEQMDNGNKIEELLREKARIDKELEKFKRPVTIMFTDIKGSTQYFERHDDIAGRVMIQKHNDIIFPIIREYEGNIIKTIGDAIMASFCHPIHAALAAIKIQEELRRYNQSLDNKEDQIKVRIGFNTRKALVEEKDIYGDAVNVASRIESSAEPEQILVSESTYEEIKEHILCRSLSPIKVRGKSEELKIYEVVWKEEDIAPLRKKAEAKVIFIEVSLEETKLNISAYERSDKGETTLRHYEEKEISIEDINTQCQEILNLFIQSNRVPKPGGDIATKLKKAGGQLYNKLFTRRIKKILSHTDARHLTINMNERLVQIPWELLYDGRDFLSRRFGMGRVVRTRQEISPVRYKEIGRPLKMLLLSDPTGDLELSKVEAKEIQSELENKQALVKLDLKIGNITKSYVETKLWDYDIIHYAGHAEYGLDDPSRSAWLLKDDRLKASDILEMTGGKHYLPSLIFSNACQSGQTQEWDIEKGHVKVFGLANAFLLAGVRHYIGTFWEVQDEASSSIAVEFYKELVKGNSVGEALRKARLRSIEKYGEDNLIWASYMLYGDPAYCYIESVRDLMPEVEEKGKRVKDDMLLEDFPDTSRSTRIPLQPGLTRNVKERAMEFWEYLLLHPLQLTISISLIVLVTLFLLAYPMIKSYIQDNLELKNKEKVLTIREKGLIIKEKEREQNKKEWEDIYELQDELDKIKIEEEKKKDPIKEEK